ncbi:hypothetical protein HX837_08090 [Marine Group I thaumarchaeote]|uniref:YncE family protein n=1 Tax=Marine Group I thaumarchaeote TaxID=2511932 RepID=A0A7K4MRY8_9ARCH|nr:hypothetical protein [Marine Group I thaumarchaeote]
MKINKIIIISLVLFISTACDNSNPTSSDSESNSSWIFVANEGNYGAGNGSVSMIDDKGQITTIDNIGDVVQSVEVYKNKLFVIVNNSHKIMIYNITENGVNLPGIEISTENSSPREMVIINDKVYFTNWNSKDVKVLNLTTYAIDSSIPIEGLPEDIITDGINLWVSIPNLELNDPSDGTKVVKINLETEQIVDIYEVGRGPQSLTLLNDDIYVSRTYYSSNWTETTFGVSKIGDVISEAVYGLGSPCGGSIMTYNNKVYRSFEGGIAPIDDNLAIQTLERIGSFDQSQVYHVEIINDYIYFTLTDYSTMNMLKKVDSNGNVLASYDVGVNPGDLAYWKKSE